MVIENEEQAQRLARAIVNDIILYNSEKIAAGRNIADEVAEGRRLFASRVSPALAGLLEAAVMASPLAMYALGSGMAQPPVEPMRYDHPPLEPPLRAEPVGGANSGLMIAIAVGVLLLAVAAAVFALR